MPSKENTTGATNAIGRARPIASTLSWVRGHCPNTGRRGARPTRNGHTRDCGCVREPLVTTHGMRHARTREVMTDMDCESTSSYSEARKARRRVCMGP